MTLSRFSGGGKPNSFFLMNKNIVSNSLLGSSGVVFWSVGGGDLNTAITITVENQSDIPTPQAATFSRMLLSVATNTLDGNTIFTFRINGGDGNQIITLPLGSGAVILQDTTNQDTVVNLDLIAYDIDLTASTINQAGRLAMSLLGVT